MLAVLGGIAIMAAAAELIVIALAPAAIIIEYFVNRRKEKR